MKCPECRSGNVSKRGKRYNRSGVKQLFLCNKCHRKFVQQDGFEGMRYNKKHIVRAVHLHNEGLSLFQIKDHLWQHDGVRVSREAIREWCNKYSVFLKSDKS